MLRVLKNLHFGTRNTTVRCINKLKVDLLNYFLKEG